VTEADLMRSIQIEASARGARLLRNNTGVLPDRRGIPVHFGLAVGSSDLIGWVKDGPVAIFAAIEVKIGNRKTTPEQNTFLAAVRAAGGRAGVARSVEEAMAILWGGG
jgi:VRR-NUC domain